jgi:hypothetical protein
MAINPQNENELWIAYTGGSNGNKVFKTSNGGTSWTNLTSALLNNESIHSIVHVAGTDGGIYIGTNNAVFYRNNSTNWVIDNTGLPTYMSTNILRPFYRDGKIRMASYGKGIWESNFNEQPSEPICRIMVDKLEQTVFCSVDSFYFEDYSFLNHQGASWSWSFPTGLPVTSTERNPAVFFANAGTHLAVLTITNQFGNSDQDSLYVTVTEFAAQAFVNEDFQTTFLPAGWFQTNYDNNAQWEQTDDAGGFGNSTQSAIFRNFDLDSQGTDDDMNITMNTLNTSALNMSFDVAYAQYGGQYSDTLEVLVSTDCGTSFTSVYLKGGSTLGTAPNSSNYFTPAASEWRTETMDLSAFTNFEKVIVAFRNKGHWGNNIYVDNINITSDLGIEETAKQFDIYPNPNVSGGKLYLEGIELGAKIILRDLNGKTILNQAISTNEITLPSSLQSGVYWINIQTENAIWNKKLIVKGE